jgi:hypothetical protein
MISRLTRKLSKTLAALVVAALSILPAHNADAVISVNIFEDATRYAVDYDLTNPFNSANVNSAKIHLQGLFDALYALPTNQVYASVDAMVADGVSFLIKNEANGGETVIGWNGVVDTNGVSLTHAPFGYEVWRATGIDPTQDQLLGRVFLEKSLFGDATLALDLGSTIPLWAAKYDFLNIIQESGNPLMVVMPTNNANAAINAEGSGFSEVSVESNFTYQVLHSSFDQDEFVTKITAANPFTSADVDSYETYFNILVDDLWSLPHNQTAYTNKAEMISQGLRHVLFDDAAAGKDVIYDGWNGNFDSTGKFTLENVGGIPNVTYELAASGKEFQFRVYALKSLFDGNGNGWSQSDVDAGIDYFITQDLTNSVLGSVYEGGALGLVEDETGKALRVAKLPLIPPSPPVNSDGAGFDLISNESNLTYSVRPAGGYPNDFRIDFFYTNPFISADVDSAELVLHQFNVDLYSLAHNQSTYSNLAAMLQSAAYNPNLRSLPTGEVSSGEGIGVSLSIFNLANLRSLPF